MKRVSLTILIACVLMLSLSGCAVHMNSEFSDLLNKTTAWSEEVSERATGGELTEAQMKEALQYNADIWNQFHRARWGLEATE